MKVMHCRNCAVVLTQENCEPSMLAAQGKVGYICKPCLKQYRSQKYRKNKKLIIEKLGNKCACCGEDRIETLTIDHIYGGGIQEKKEFRGEQFLRKLLIQENLTEKYQCLCFNCNYAKGFFGVCPHQL